MHKSFKAQQRAWLPSVPAIYQRRASARKESSQTRVHRNTDTAATRQTGATTRTGEELASPNYTNELSPRLTPIAAGSPEEEASENFSWTKQWYPVAIASALPTDRPTAVRLLGQPMVVWRDDSSTWHCWQDLCPHRLAPLSEGRIEGGGLVCSYHGWKFNGEGKCTRIPQADDERSLLTALASRRSCATLHPTQVANGLIWVWGESGAQSAALARPPSTVPLVDDPTAVHLARWFMRDLPYSADILAENVLDPDHVAYSHHGLLGDRNNPRRLCTEAVSEIRAQEGFEVSMSAEPVGNRKAYRSTISWHPPTMVKYVYSNGMTMVSHATPTDPGKSRLFFTMVQPADKAPWALRVLLPLLRPPWLQWIDHFSQHQVLDGDSVFLHHQDQELQREGWQKGYYVPSSKDRAVIGLRRWLGQVGPIPWAKSALQRPISASRRELLDRFEQHTRACPSCSKAFKVFSALRLAAGAAAILTFAGLLGCVRGGLAGRAAILPAGVTVALCALAVWTDRIRHKFIFIDYVHAEH